LADALLGKAPERVRSSDEYAKAQPDGLQELFWTLRRSGCCGRTGL